MLLYLLGKDQHTIRPCSQGVPANLREDFCGLCTAVSFWLAGWWWRLLFLETWIESPSTWLMPNACRVMSLPRPTRPPEKGWVVPARERRLHAVSARVSRRVQVRCGARSTSHLARVLVEEIERVAGELRAAAAPSLDQEGIVKAWSCRSAPFSER